MSIALKKRPGDGVPTPPPSHLTFFVDENGNPSLKDSDGVITPATSAGGPSQYNVLPDAPDPTAGSAKVYSKNVGGVSELFAINDFGQEVQITSGGSLAAVTATMKWKDDTPGELYDATSTVPTLVDVVQVLIDSTTDLSGEGDKEGVVVSAGDRVLRACALSQTEDQIANGIYIVASGAWTRAPDADTGAAIQDAIVEMETDPGPPEVTQRWAFWNPSGVPITVGDDPQNWVIVIESAPPAVDSADVVAVANVASLSGEGSTIDGQVLAADDVVLLSAQTDPIENGVWTVATGAWTRPSPFEEGAVQPGGIAVAVSSGVTYFGTTWILNHPKSESVVMGTDPQSWLLYNTQDYASWGPVRVDVDFYDMVAGRSPRLDSPTSGYVILTLPPITPESATKAITFLNYLSKKAKKKTGTSGAVVVVQPAPGDAVSPDLGAGETAVVWSTYEPLRLISDGVGTWLLDSSLGFALPIPLAIDAGFLPEPPGPS